MVFGYALHVRALPIDVLLRLHAQLRHVREKDGAAVGCYRLGFPFLSAFVGSNTRPTARARLRRSRAVLLVM